MEHLPCGLKHPLPRARTGGLPIPMMRRTPLKGTATFDFAEVGVGGKDRRANSSDLPGKHHERVGEIGTQETLPSLEHRRRRLNPVAINGFKACALKSCESVVGSCQPMCSSCTAGLP